MLYFTALAGSREMYDSMEFSPKILLCNLDFYFMFSFLSLSENHH